MRLQEKLEKILIEQKLKSSDFISQTGISKTSFYAIKNGKTKKLSPDNAKSISSKFPEYSYEWLMSEQEEEAIYIGKNEDLNVNDFLEVFFLYKDKIESSERFKLYIKEIKQKGIIEYQRDRIDELKLKKQ